MGTGMGCESTILTQRFHTFTQEICPIFSKSLWTTVVPDVRSAVRHLVKQDKHVSQSRMHANQDKYDDGTKAAN